MRIRVLPSGLIAYPALPRSRAARASKYCCRVEAARERLRQPARDCYFFYRHFPVLGAVGPRHVQQPLLFGFSPDFLASRAERRTEESRGFPRNRFYRLLHISDLPIDLLFAFLLQVDMIPRVIAYRLSALVKELDNIRMLFNPVPVQEKKSLSLYACRAYPAASG